MFRGMYLVCKYEGFLGLYKGLTAAWGRECIYSTLRLGLYEPFKRLYGETDPEHTPLYIKLLSGGSSGMVGQALANPTDLVKVRMQASEDKKLKLGFVIKDVYTHWGLMGFFKGVVPSVVRAILLNAAKLASYDHIKHAILNNHILSDGYGCHFLSSFCAGFCEAAVSCPADLLKTRIMN